MKEYFFVQQSEYEEFEKSCSEKLQDGWTAQGGIFVLNNDGDLTFFQAFIR